MAFRSEKKSSDQIVEEIANDILHQLPETVEELAEGDVRASSTGLFTLRLKHILTRELPDLRDKEKNRGEACFCLSDSCRNNFHESGY